MAILGLASFPASCIQWSELACVTTFWLQAARVLIRRILLIRTIADKNMLKTLARSQQIVFFYATSSRPDLDQDESPLTWIWSLRSQSLVQLLACFQWQKSYICSWDMVPLTAYYMLFVTWVYIFPIMKLWFLVDARCSCLEKEGGRESACNVDFCRNR
jgi:hypothetical protein